MYGGERGVQGGTNRRGQRVGAAVEERCREAGGAAATRFPRGRHQAG